jgi:pimeloyl-ACP methyl ester carboxylesterase
LAAIARRLADAPDLTEQLAALEVPVEVVRGERDDAWPHATQDRLASALGTRVVIIEDAGHSPAREQPEQTRDALVRLWMS